MDIYCPKCGEPTDNDSIHDAVNEGIFDSYVEGLHAFQSQGCEAFGWKHGNINAARAEAMSAMFDLLGDDVDGAAAMMEDFDYMF